MPGNQPNVEGANQIQVGFPLLYKGAIQSVKERLNFELLHCGEEWESVDVCPCPKVGLAFF